MEKTGSTRTKSKYENAVIDRIWEYANHGTRREDVEAAYDAGYAEAMRWCAYFNRI